MKPNARCHLPDAGYLRRLCMQAQLSPRQAGELIGISDRLMRYYLTPATAGITYREAPYAVQFGLEQLAYGDPSPDQPLSTVDAMMEAHPPISYLIEHYGQDPERTEFIGPITHLASLMTRNGYLVPALGKAMSSENWVMIQFGRLLD